MQRYGIFEGFPWKIVHCLGWCHIMTPVKSNIDTKHCHVQRELPFPRPIILGIYASFQGCS